MDISRIVTFMTCKVCHKQKPGNESMEKWARLNVGITPTGIEVWCVRHRMLVVHFTPDELQKKLEQPLQCSCCPNGQHIGPPKTLNN